MAPAIVSDSNVSLPEGLAGGLPLFLAPLEVRIGAGVYTDGVDITPTRFYQLIAQGENATTSAPTPGAFLRAFEQAGEVSNEVICITLSAALSAAYRSAAEAVELARSTLPDLHVVLIDSHSAAAAQGLIALDAVRAAAAGASRDEIIARVDRRIADTVLFGYLGSMRHLWRSGRIPLPLMWMGAVLNVKPLLRLENDAIGMVERPRSEAKARRRLVALAQDRLAGRPGRVAVLHADAPEQAGLLAEAIRSAVATRELFIAELTPAIGAHTGPGLVACALHPADD